MSPLRSFGGSHEGGQTGSGHENAEPVLLAPLGPLVGRRLASIVSDSVALERMILGRLFKREHHEIDYY